MSLFNYTTHDTIFDIVGFIEKNPLSRLSFIYQNTLINKIKRDFNEEEQKIFVTSFYSYLNFNPLTDFIIDFDDVWKWCGYTRKDQSKRVLEKHFVVNVDYKVVFRQPAENSKGGRPTEKISLNILTFKKFCLKADTKKADEIHNYYIKLETILQETLNEESNELRLQLEEKKEELQQSDLHIKKLENKILKKQQRLICDDKNYIYIVTSPIHTTDRIYIVGRAVDLPGRLSTYNKTIEHELVYSKACKSREHMNIIETMILLKLDKYRERINRDRFILPVNSNISLFIDIVNSAVKWFEDIEEYVCIYDDKDIGLTNEELQQKFIDDDEDEENIRKENMKEYKKEYRLKNLAKITEQDSEYREDHKEEKKITDKIYRENNKEKIAENNKLYYENNKDEILDKQKIYYENNKEEILERQQIFYEDNKDILNQQKKEYRDENKEKVNQQKKVYREKYKEQINDKQRDKRHGTEQVKIVCVCGIKLNIINSKSIKHINSKKHQEFIKNSEEKIEK